MLKKIIKNHVIIQLVHRRFGRDNLFRPNQPSDFDKNLLQSESDFLV